VEYRVEYIARSGRLDVVDEGTGKVRGFSTRAAARKFAASNLIGKQWFVILA